MDLRDGIETHISQNIKSSTIYPQWARNPETFFLKRESCRVSVADNSVEPMNAMGSGRFPFQLRTLNNFTLFFYLDLWDWMIPVHIGRKHLLYQLDKFKFQGHLEISLQTQWEIVLNHLPGDPEPIKLTRKIYSHCLQRHISTHCAVFLKII